MMSDSNQAAILSRLSRNQAPILVLPMDSKVFSYSLVLSSPILLLTLFDRLLIATVGRQIPSSTCFLIETANLENISGYLLQNPLKLITSLSYKKPCLQVSW